MEVPNDDLTSADIVPGAKLSGADLSEAELREADLSGADLREADLSEAPMHSVNPVEYLQPPGLDAPPDPDGENLGLPGADLSEADLRRANLPGAGLGEATLTDANLRGANLSGAYLRKADLSGANLRGADLSGANLLDAELAEATLSRETQLDRLSLADVKGMLTDGDSTENEEELDPEEWDAIARVYHDLKTVCSANGLISRAREFRVRERTARRREARAIGNLRGILTWGGSLFSRVITGYGVQLTPIVVVMSLIYVASTVVYVHGDIESPFYYSIVTFTTAPPRDPPADLLVKLVAMAETFMGTLLVVVLGAVLGNREQV